MAHPPPQKPKPQSQAKPPAVSKGAAQPKGNKAIATVLPGGALGAPLQKLFEIKGPLPRAAIVYAAGASMVFVSMLFCLFAGNWVTALILLGISAVLMGTAVVMIRSQR